MSLSPISFGLGVAAAMLIAGLAAWFAWRWLRREALSEKTQSIRQKAEAMREAELARNEAHGLRQKLERQQQLSHQLSQRLEAYARDFQLLTDRLNGDRDRVRKLEAEYLAKYDELVRRISGEDPEEKQAARKRMADLGRKQRELDQKKRNGDLTPPQP